jgi:ATP synthase protein I
MTQEHQRPAQPQGGDPWHAVGYLVSGVFVYCLLGWLADRWLGTSFLVAVGIMVGASLGLYLTWNRFTQPIARNRKTD